MSYILEALKKADAERGQAPSSLTVLPVSHLATSSTEARSAFKAMWWIGAAVLAAGGAMLLTLNRSSQPNAGVGPTPQAAAQRSDMAEAPASASATSGTASATRLLAASTSPAPKAGSAAVAPVQPIFSELPPPPAPRARPQTAAAGPAKPLAKTSNQPPAAQASPLTAVQRAALPSLEVSGSSYSVNPAHRMLIVNGQVVKEGQAVAPDLTLESIGPRSAVFNQRGLRFNVNY